MNIIYLKRRYKMYHSKESSCYWELRPSKIEYHLNIQYVQHLQTMTMIVSHVAHSQGRDMSITWSQNIWNADAFTLSHIHTIIIITINNQVCQTNIQTNKTFYKNLFPRIWAILARKLPRYSQKLVFKRVEY